VIKEGVLEKIDFPILGVIPGVESFASRCASTCTISGPATWTSWRRSWCSRRPWAKSKIAVLATDNPNGESVIAYLNGTLAKRNLKLAAAPKYVIGPKIDWAPAIKAFQTAQPDVVILLGPPFATAGFIKEAKTAGLTSSLYGLSYTDHRLATKLAGNQLVRGVAIAQVFPNPANRVVPLIKEFRDNFEKYGKVQGVPSHFNLEGYIAGKIIVEAIRKSKDSSAAGVARAWICSRTTTWAATWWISPPPSTPARRSSTCRSSAGRAS